jgi:CarD family transcriptional regulator
MKAKKTTIKSSNKNTSKSLVKQKTDSSSQKLINKTKEKLSESNKKTSINNLEENIKTSHSKNKDYFNVNNYIVYPSHGVGKIINIDNLKILNQEHNLYIIYFEKEKLTIKIPVEKAEKYGIRHLVSKKEIEDVLAILRGGIKKIKGMWSRRAQEYEEKINSGNIVLLAEVIRDLTRDILDSDRSFSERLIYETAIFRLASEYAIIFNISVDLAKEKIISVAKDKVISDSKNKDFDLDFDDIVKSLKEDEEDDDDDDEEEEDDDEEHYKSLDKYSQEDDEEDFMEQFKKAEKSIKKDKKTNIKSRKLKK